MKSWWLQPWRTGALMTLIACATAGNAPPSAAALALSLARSDGRTIELGAYAGKPLLLFLFATYDEPSQLALVALTQFSEQNPGLQVAAVLVQPDAATFLPLFKDAVTLPFELYYDPQQHLLRGDTALGQLRGVPAFVSLDASGRIRDTRYGVLKLDELKQLTDL